MPDDDLPVSLMLTQEMGAHSFDARQGGWEIAVDTETSDFRWGVEQLFAFTKYRLFWEGHANRWADASRYLPQLCSVSDGVQDREDSSIVDLPPDTSAPTPNRGINPVMPRSVVSALHRSQAIEAKHQSLSSPEPLWRWTASHADASDGFRWHTRAFCLTDKTFKDFLLSRLIEIPETRESRTASEDDLDRKSEVTVEVGPLRDLSETQAKAIALDYGMEGAKAKIRARPALLNCALRRLGLDTDPAARRPQVQQFVLWNRDVVNLQDRSEAR